MNSTITKKTVLICLALIFIICASFAQVGINNDNSAPDSSAMLDVKSPDLGFLPPRVVSLDSIQNPAAGLMVYDLTHNCMRYFNGNDWSQCMGKPFQCGDPFMDARDGKTYKTVSIGGQCWMAENLNIGIMIMGSEIPSNNLIIEKYCHNNDEVKCNTYGGLYRWDEMMNYSTIEADQGICPSGWHIPSDGEIQTLEIELGMDSISANMGGFRGTDQGSRLAGYADMWDDGNLENEPDFGTSNFNLIPAGVHAANDVFYENGFRTDIWTSTEFNEFVCYGRIVYHYSTQISRGASGKTSNRSVRCIKD